MTTQTPDEPNSTTRPTTELLAIIINAPDDAARERAIENFLREREPLFAVLAARLCPRFRINARLFAEDVRSEIAIVALSMLRRGSLLTDKRGEPIRNWEGYLNWEATEVIRKLAESPEWAGSSGTSGKQRKLRGLAVSREKLRAILDREPSDREIVDYHNGRMADPEQAKQHGRTVSEDDLHEVYFVEIDENIDSPRTAVGDDDCPLFPTEAIDAVMATIAAAEKTSPHLGAAAHAYFDGYLREPQEVRTVADVQLITGSSYEMARRRVFELHLIARDVLLDSFGINGAHGSLDE